VVAVEVETAAAPAGVLEEAFAVEGLATDTVPDEACAEAAKLVKLSMKIAAMTAARSTRGREPFRAARADTRNMNWFSGKRLGHARMNAPIYSRRLFL
jgi:hypothetical protein